MERSELLDLLLAVAQNPPRSLLEAHNLEAALIPHMDLPGIEAFVIALSLYEPTNLERDGLVGYEGLRAAARESLHEFGRHDFCVH